MIHSNLRRPKHSYICYQIHVFVMLQNENALCKEHILPSGTQGEGVGTDEVRKAVLDK